MRTQRKHPSRLRFASYTTSENEDSDDDDDQIRSDQIIITIKLGNVLGSFCGNDKLSRTVLRVK